MKITKNASYAAVLLCGVMLFAAGCGGGAKNYEDDVKPYDKDFSAMNASKQEKTYDYKFGFLPEEDDGEQGYVGDTMPYYENGTYYVYYLKDRGDSFNHSVYLATTTDFVHWEEKQDPVLRAAGSGQEMMIGTGSVVKVGEKYYFFYTGNNGSEAWKENGNAEAIMVAEGTSPTSFTKKADWAIKADESVLKKHDFRDPQAYYDAAAHQITLTVTAQNTSGTASVVKYTLDENLNATCGGIIYTNDASVVGSVYNLECSDTFKFGDKWYLTFSAQDGVVWYTSADTQYGPYTATPKPLDGHLFYAAKHASDGTNTYLIGWTRRSESVSDTSAVGHLKGWGGNLQVQKVVSDGAGGLRLAPVDAYMQNIEERVLVSGSSVEVQSGDYTEAFRCFERYMVTGKFSGTGEFGFAFDYNGRPQKYKTIVLSPKEQRVSFALNQGEDPVTSVAASLEEGKEYAFTYIQEGSVGVLYVEGQTALTVRLYGVSGKNVMLWAENGSASFTGLKQYTYTY